jgi:hypothetical protein
LVCWPSQRDQRLTQSDGHGNRVPRFRHPDPVNLVKGLQALRQRVRDDQRHVSLGRALIVADLAQPGITPVPGPLGFPQDRAKDLTGRTDHPLYQVAAELALGYGLKHVARKFLAQQRFECKLLNLALQLLRALFGFAPQVFDLSLHRRDLFFLLPDPQGQGGFGLVFGLIADGTAICARWSRMAASRPATSASFRASWSWYRLRVSSMSGAASDSVSLIFVRQVGQVRVGSVIVRVPGAGRESPMVLVAPVGNSRC